MYGDNAVVPSVHQCRANRRDNRHGCRATAANAAGGNRAAGGGSSLRWLQRTAGGARLARRTRQAVRRRTPPYAHMAMADAAIFVYTPWCCTFFCRICRSLLLQPLRSLRTAPCSSDLHFGRFDRCSVALLRSTRNGGQAVADVNRAAPLHCARFGGGHPQDGAPPSTSSTTPPSARHQRA